VTPRTDPSPLPPGVLLEREPVGSARGRGRRHQADARPARGGRPPAGHPRRRIDGRHPPVVPPGADLDVDLDLDAYLAPSPDVDPDPDLDLALDLAPSADDVDLAASPDADLDLDLDVIGPVREIDLTEPPAEIDLTDAGAAFDGPAVDDDPAGDDGEPASVAPELTVVAPSTEPTAEAESAESTDDPDAPSATGDEDVDQRSRWRAVAQVAAWTTAVVAVAIVLLVFVFPTRTYMAQRRQLSDAASELKLLDTQNAQLAGQVARLRTDAEIERIAREQYHLVRPGESAIAILPPPSSRAPATAPAPPPHKPHASWLDRLTSWIP
jgi:cell division protein FtsB